MSTFTDTPQHQPIHQVVTPLFAIRDGREEYINGTAFLIGRGWAVTAYHVLEDFVLRFEGRYSHAREINTSFEILGYFTLDGGSRFLPIKVVRAWRAAPLDLALLAFGVPEDWPDDHVWKVPALDMFPPKVGTEVVAIGFPNSRFERCESGQGPTLTVNPKVSTGRVLEIHHAFRDKVQLPFPCFRSDARFDGGMSGGPVLNNSNGHICGVVCSSMEGTVGEGGYISYASSLWPIIATMIDAGEGSVSGADPYPALQLFRNKVLEARGLEAVHLLGGRDGTLSAGISYDAAEWDSPSVATGGGT